MNMDNPNALNPNTAGISMIWSNRLLPSENAYFASVPPVAAQIAAKRHVGTFILGRVKVTTISESVELECTQNEHECAKPLKYSLASADEE